MPDGRSASVAVCGLVVVLATVVPGPGSHGPSEQGDVPAVAAESAPPAPEVVVDPANWWMETGTNASFSAAWTGPPPGCALDPIWFRWSVLPGGSAGVLEITNGSRTVFAASSGATGTTTLVVRAAASLACGKGVLAAFTRATAAVTVAAPVAVVGLGFATNPLPPNASADLVGTIAGGDAPYVLRVAWGDGSVSEANVTAAGPFSVSHVYVAAGTFEPVVVATDSAGQSASAQPQEALNVSDGFAAAIQPSALVVDVGTPVDFSVRTLDAPAGFSSLFGCQNSELVSSQGPGGLDYGCAFTTAGVAPVSFQAVGATSPYLVATAALRELVVPRLSAGFPAGAPAGEVGETVYAPVLLEGGVPPFTVNWSLVGAGTAGSEGVPSDGVAYLPLQPASAGALDLSVTAVDALDQESLPVSETVTVLPPLATDAFASASPAGRAVSLNLSASVLAGASPFAWTVVAGAPATNASASAGTLADAASFAWNATYGTEGTVNVTVVVVDATGASTVENLSVGLAPPLSVRATVVPTGPGTVTLEVNVSGGVAPYSYLWNDSAGDAWNGSSLAPGSLVLRERSSCAGPCSFRVAVVDALGASASAQLEVNVSSPTSTAAAGPSATVALAAALVLGVAGAGALLLRRRRPAQASAPPDPVAVLREVIAPADGVDLGLVELLAEEQGVPREVVHTTLARLKAEGTVRSGRGADGEEVLAWDEPPSR